MSSDDSAARVRDAASLLVKGGTLISEPCPKCGGVQVRFARKMTCINCGNERSMDSDQGEPEHQIAVERDQSLVPSLQSSAVFIEEKIALLASEIGAESDISVQKQ